MKKQMDGIRTISDLSQAQMLGEQALIDACFSQVSILPDLEKYLRWLFDNGITTEVHSKLHRRKGRELGVHPSTICKTPVCLLKIYYECTGKVEPMREYEQKSQVTFDIGTLMHDTMQTWLAAMFEDQLKVEAPLKNKKLHITGHTDGLFTFPSTRFVLELKSIKEGGNYGWERVQLKPMEDNVRQAHVYMAIEDVPFANVFYMGKNNSDYKEHPIMFDNAIWENMLRNVVEPVVEAAYNQGQSVPASPGWNCKYCDFLHGCAEGRSKQQNAKRATSRTSRIGR